MFEISYDMVHRYGWPTCAICNKSVDELITTFDPCHGSRGMQIFVVRCHGQEERVEISSEMLELYDARGGYGKFTLNGTAFVQHKMLET